MEIREYNKYMGSPITNDIGVYVKSIQIFYGKRGIHQQIRLKFKEETDEMLHFDHSFLCH